jgi:hypothetical protein
MVMWPCFGGDDVTYRDLALHERSDASAQVKVRRADTPEIPVRLRLLGYDGCEFETRHRFKPGEQVSIHLFRMGWIRARVVSCRAGVVEAEFVKECPV